MKYHSIRDQHAEAIATSRRLVCDALALVAQALLLAEETAAARRRSAEVRARMSAVRSGLPQRIAVELRLLAGK